MSNDYSGGREKEPWVPGKRPNYDFWVYYLKGKCAARVRLTRVEWESLIPWGLRNEIRARGLAPIRKHWWEFWKDKY